MGNDNERAIRERQALRALVVYPQMRLLRPHPASVHSTVLVAAALIVLQGLSQGLEVGSWSDREPPTARPTSPTLTLAAAADAARRVWLTFESPAQASGERVTKVENVGTGATHVRIAARDFGAVTSTRSLSGAAARLPVYQGGSAPRRAVIVVTNATSTDALDPGTQHLLLGVDFRLDSVSDGSAVDDGDNLVQRGLFDGSAQYKLQVDHRRPGCVITGSAGRVKLFAPATVEPSRWYRLECSRRGTEVTLSLTDLTAGGRRTWRTFGNTGSLTPSSIHLPLSVGGKVGDDGFILPRSDQFNGSIDNVVVNIG